MAFSNTNRILSNYFICNKSLYKSRFVMLNEIFKIGVKNAVEKPGKLPKKPKRPVPGYFKFFVKIFPELVVQHPKDTRCERTYRAASLWYKMDIAERKEYESHYYEEFKEYKKQLAIYESNLTDEDKQVLERSRQLQRKRRKERRINKEAIAYGKPKKPLSPFAVYVKSLGESLYTAEHNTFKEMWNKLSESEKEKFQKQSEALQEAHIIETAKWEEKMINEGRSDLLSKSSRIEGPEILKLKLKRPSSNEPVKVKKKTGRPLRKLPWLMLPPIHKTES